MDKTHLKLRRRTWYVQVAVPRKLQGTHPLEQLIGHESKKLAHNTGYGIQENTGAGADGGIDLTISKDGEGCRCARCQELFGVVAAENATGGIIVCSGNFTRDAIEFARGKPIELVSGSKLTQLIGDTQKQKRAKPVLHETACPSGGSPMVVRTARRGKNIGSSFWGCTRFPKCRSTRSMG